MGAPTQDAERPMSLSLEEEFPLVVMQVGRACRRIADAAAAEFGLTEATALPLVHLSRMTVAPKQSEIADVMRIERPSVAWLLDQLSSQGLVERRTDDEDRRAKRIHLTPEGRRIAERIDEILVSERKQLLVEIEASELEIAFSVLSRISGRARTRTGIP